jgi:ABC-type multidrug transport system permease subunit
MLINALGAMLFVVKQFPLRSIFYKQQDANFYPTWTYVVGRSVATIPSAAIDSFLYGSIVFFFAGLAFNDGASFANYIVFLLSLFVLSLTTGLFFSMYSAALRDINIAQAAMALSVIVLVLFSGFTVQPDVIPM